MEEHRATPILTRTHAHTPHTHIHTQQWPVCVGPTWALLASAQAQAQHPGGADTAAPASTGAGWLQCKAGQGPPSRNSQAAGKACSLLLTCVLGARPAPPPADCTWGRRTTSNDFKLPETHLDSDLGSWDFTGGSQDPHRSGGLQQARKTPPTGKQHLATALPAPQPSEGAGNVQPVHTAHSTRLHSHVLPQPPQQGKSPQGLLQRGSNCGKSCTTRAPGPGAGPSRPSWLGDRPRKDAGGPLAPGQTRHTPASLPACPSHTTGVPGPLCCPGAAEAWLAPVSVPVQAWVAAPQAGTRFLPFFPDKAGQQVVCHSGGSSWRHPPQPETLSPPLCREEGGGGRPELSAGPTLAGGSRPGASLSFSLPHGARVPLWTLVGPEPAWAGPSAAT